MNALAWIGKHATGLLALGVFAGLLAPQLATIVRPALVPVIVAMFVISLLRLDVPAVLNAARRPGLVLPAVGFVLVVSPCIGYVGVRLAGIEAAFGPGIAMAVVIWTASPPLISVTALATILRLDNALALIAMTAGGLLMPLTLPPIVFGLIGLDLQIGILDLILRLLVLVAFSGILAAGIRRIVGRERLARNAEAVDGSFVVVMIVFAIAVMDGVSAALVADPAKVWGIVGLVFAVSLSLQATALILFLPLGRRTATTVALVAGNRNMAIVLGAAPAAFSTDAFLFLALLQFPIYLLPALLKPVYRRLGG